MFAPPATPTQNPRCAPVTAHGSQAHRTWHRQGIVPGTRRTLRQIRGRLPSSNIPLDCGGVVGGGVWSDIQIPAQLKLARRPPRPNLVSLLSTVVEKVSGLGVVGFTIPFISGYTLLHQQPPWSFSQKWLRELVGAVDLPSQFTVRHPTQRYQHAKHVYQHGYELARTARSWLSPTHNDMADGW